MGVGWSGSKQKFLNKIKMGDTIIKDKQVLNLKRVNEQQNA